MIKKIVCCALLSGCAPYAGYTHLSDPRIANDGYDLVCLGGVRGERLSLDLAVCDNLAPYGGEFVKAEIRFEL